MSAQVGVDDHAMVRVPPEERYSWWSRVLLGSTIGFGSHCTWPAAACCSTLDGSGHQGTN